MLEINTKMLRTLSYAPLTLSEWDRILSKKLCTGYNPLAPLPSIMANSIPNTFFLSCAVVTIMITIKEKLRACKHL